MKAYMFINAMRGQSLADFQKTRNAPGALYSVSAQPREPR